MVSKGISQGQAFTAGDGGIKVTVIRVGSSKEKARFKVENLNAQKASYTVIVTRRSGADPDRIQYETDNPNNPGEYELSADETTGVEIKRNA
jgi:hypothetical protein